MIPGEPFVNWSMILSSRSVLPGGSNRPFLMRGCTSFLTAAPLCHSISQRSSPNTLRSLCMPTSEPEQEWTPRARPDVLAGQQLPPAPQQERSRRKREALLMSALALFAERGYEQTSIEDIARSAEVAVGGFYQHFTSKRQILLVLMDRLLQEVSGLSWEAKSPEPADILDGIARLIRQALTLDWAYAGAYRAWHEAVVRDRELLELHHQIEAWSASQLTLLFR